MATNIDVGDNSPVNMGPLLAPPASRILAAAHDEYYNSVPTRWQVLQRQERELQQCQEGEQGSRKRSLSVASSDSFNPSLESSCDSESERLVLSRLWRREPSTLIKSPQSNLLEIEEARSSLWRPKPEFEVLEPTALFEVSLRLSDN